MTASTRKREMPTAGETGESTSNIIWLYSDGFQAVNEWFQACRPPYNYRDILQFNALYQCAYPMLSREEKRRIEEWVDALIEGVEDRKLIPKIFGVV